MSHSRLAAISTIAWMACLQFFLAEQIARSAWTLPYSFASNYVSDLGAVGCSALVCSPWHALMNASFVLQGLLIMSGALLTWRQWNLPGRLGLCLLLLSGSGVVVVGFVPEDVSGGLHRLAAAVHFLGAGLAMIAVGLSARGIFRWLSIIVGVTVLSATVQLGLGHVWIEKLLGIGTIERLAAYGIAGWMAALGAWLYWRMKQAASVSPY